MTRIARPHARSFGGRPGWYSAPVGDVVVRGSHETVAAAEPDGANEPLAGRHQHRRGCHVARDGLLGAFRTAWLPLVVGPLFLVTGVINCTGAIVRWRADRRQAGGDPDQG